MHLNKKVTNMAKQTKTTAQKSMATTAMHQVCSILQMSQQQYANYQYKAGCNYLQHYIPNDPQGIDMLIESKLFWNWFKLHWSKRDAEFIQAANGLSQAEAVALFDDIHNPSILAAGIRPNSVVLGESYARLIGQIIDHQNTQHLCR